MKVFSFLLAFALFISALIFPVIELLGVFTDMIRINSAILVCGRAAAHMSADPTKLRDVKVELSMDAFNTEFSKNFCTMLNLKDDFSPDNSKDCRYNAFQISLVPKYIDKDGNEANVIDEKGQAIKNCVEINMTTNYKFKTSLLKRFESQIKKPTVLRISRLQRIKIIN